MAIGLVLLAAISAVATADEAYRAQVRKWRVDHEEGWLKGEADWLAVAGLFWLKEGPNGFGTDPAGDIVLPAGSAPAKAGVFTSSAGRVTVTLLPGATGKLAGKPLQGAGVLRADPSSDVLEVGALRMTLIERGGRLGIRLKDKNSAAKKAFTGLRWFDVKEEYRVEARWVAYPEPKPLNLPNVLGQIQPMRSPGYAEFTLGGKPLRLDGVLESSQAEELFFIFRDLTSGKETYGGGRFLYSDLPKAGKVVLDFNKAYSPPCAFTDFATCPLPPPQNRMPIRVEAGELAYSRPGH